MGRCDEEGLSANIVELARQYGCSGYRKIAALLRSSAGWVVNNKRVERNRSAVGSSLPTDPASVCGPSGRTMFGRTTLLKTARKTTGSIGC